MSPLYVRRLIFSCDFVSLYPVVHFPCMYLSGIIVITNRISDRLSTRKISLWIFTSAKLFSSAVNSTLQVSKVLLINSMTSFEFLYIFMQGIIQLQGTMSSVFLQSIQARAKFLRLALLLLKMFWSIFLILFVPQGTGRGLLADRNPPRWFVPLVIATSSAGTVWVYNCLRRFLFGDLSGPEWFYLWLPIQVYLVLVDIYTFRWPVCRGWLWFFIPESVYSNKELFSLVFFF